MAAIAATPLLRDSTPSSGPHCIPNHSRLGYEWTSDTGQSDIFILDIWNQDTEYDWQLGGEAKFPFFLRFYFFFNYILLFM